MKSFKINYLARLFLEKKVSERVLGVDLGTTYSVTAILEGGKPVVIPNLEGDKTTPSVVAFESDGTAVVGRNAKRQAIVNPLNTYFSVKRYMGKKNRDLLGEGEGCKLAGEYISRSFELVGEESVGFFKRSEAGETTFSPSSSGATFLDNSVLLNSPALGEGLRPEFIAAKLLQKLASDASTYIQENLSKVVITVPAYFDDLQRKATTAAGKIAGLDVVKIINEPSSAAFAYGFDKVLEERILVFDLGGGTFDVSVLEVSDRVFEVLSTGGNSALGGDDFDQAIVSYILEVFHVRGGQDLSSQLSAMQRIIEAAELAKIRLSASNSTIINLPFLCSARKDVLHDLTSIKVDITRELFEKLTSGLVDGCLASVKSVLEDAQLSADDLSKNVLVGGSTRMPCVKNVLLDYLKKPASDSINPDEVVALGAALQGGLISGEIDNLVLLDVLSLSLGLEVEGGIMQNLVGRNTVIPVSRTQTFSTSVNNQPAVEVLILQGERRMAKDNKTLGRFQLNVQRAAAGIPRIGITFDISSDGVLFVTGVDEATNETQKISVSLDNSLTSEQIAELVARAEENTLYDDRRVMVAGLEVRYNKIESAFKALSDDERTKFSENLESSFLNEENLDLVRKEINELSGKIEEEGVNPSGIEDLFPKITEKLQEWENFLFKAQNTEEEVGDVTNKAGNDKEDLL